jgi:hypothetical protein
VGRCAPPRRWTSEGPDLIQLVELHLDEARKRVTAAGVQSTQDGYLYFFASLKVSEFRMLEAACKPHLQPKGEGAASVRRGGGAAGAHADGQQGLAQCG